MNNGISTTDLRKAGKIKEAYLQAKTNFEQNPTDKNKIDYGWVLYDIIKQNNSVAKIIKALKIIEKVAISESENMLWSQLNWQLGKLVLKLKKANTHQEDLYYLFLQVQKVIVPRNTDEGKFLVKMFLNALKKHAAVYCVCEWWGWNNFAPTDFMPQATNDPNVTYAPLAETMLNAYCNNLITGILSVKNTILGANSKVEINKEKINNFLPILSDFIEKQPEYKFLPYYKAKMLLLTGENTESLKAFLPFARKKSKDFWVWQLLAEVHKNDSEKQLSCLCKGLSLQSKPEFVIKLRQQLAEKLVLLSHYEEAKTEINQIIAIRQKKGWKIPSDLEKLTKATWYIKAQGSANNKAFYEKHKHVAEALLFDKAQQQIVVIDHINTTKKVANFVNTKHQAGYFSYKGNAIELKVGDLVEVVFRVFEVNGFCLANSIKPVGKPLDTKPLRKAISGKLLFDKGKSFGFVKGVFVSPGLIEKHGLKNNDIINGEAIISYNAKKNSTGWKLIKVD